MTGKSWGELMSGRAPIPNWRNDVSGWRTGSQNLYYCLGQLRTQGIVIEVKQAIQDLRDYWNRYIDNSKRPAALKFQVDAKEDQVQ